ncbi:MAG: hypothetical protein JWO95_742 [Verrucomicrobiales bacterium]|nr:hypothetical protein [Verrucomicrobiales bacterium]
MGKDDSEAVKVWEDKTVGAYQIAILSSGTSKALTDWLSAHQFSFPQTNAAVLDSYVTNNWYFVAIRINLTSNNRFSARPGTPKQVEAVESLDRDLASGELHPLHISFDTPKCIFPLKISALNGKPSEVSLYIFSKRALCNKNIVDLEAAKLADEKKQWLDQKPQRDAKARAKFEKLRDDIKATFAEFESQQKQAAEAGQPLRDMQNPRIRARAMGHIGNWKVLNSDTQAPEEDDRFPGLIFEKSPRWSAYEWMGDHPLVDCVAIGEHQLPKCRKQLPRLGKKPWFVTKQVATFTPDRMQDLIFEPAVSVVADYLGGEYGYAAAGTLDHFGDDGRSALLNSLSSTNATRQLHACTVFQYTRDARAVKLLSVLLAAPDEKLRITAANASSLNFDPSLAQPLTNLLDDSNPRVVAAALDAIDKTNRITIPHHKYAKLFAAGAGICYTAQSIATKDPNPLSGADVAALVHNEDPFARFLSLKLLRTTGDARAVELALELLTDTEPLICYRAGEVLQKITSQDFPADKPEQWKRWWKTHQTNFTPLSPVLLKGLPFPGPTQLTPSRFAD